MNAGIILAGQPLNTLAALNAGTTAARNTNQVRHENALTDLYRTQGPGLMAGDANALNALSRLNPEAAFGLRADQERLQLAQAAGARAAAAAAASQSAAERAAQEEQIRRGLDAARTAQTPEEWDALAAQFGAEDLIGQFGQRDAVIAYYEGYTAPQAPSYREHGGTLYRETPDGLVPEIEGTPEAPTFRPATPGELQAYGAASGQIDTQTGRFYPGPQQQAGSSIRLPDGTTVDLDGGTGVPSIGTVPQGYSVVQDPSSPAGYRMVPIPGGPEDTSQADATAAEVRGNQTDIVMDEISRARDLIENQGVVPTTGPIGALVGGALPNTPAGALSQRLQTIRANIGFERLQQMRDASPTGGALGQVSEMENRLLQSVYGSLEQAQSAEELLYNLERIESIYTRVVHEGIPEAEARQLIAGGAESNIENLDIAGLLGLNLDDLSDSEIVQYNARMRELLND